MLTGFVEVAPHPGAGSPTTLPSHVPLLSAVVVFGAFQITRQHLVGLSLVLLLPIALDFYSNWLATLAYAFFALIVFGSPFMLARIESRRASRDGAS